MALVRPKPPAGSVQDSGSIQSLFSKPSSTGRKRRGAGIPVAPFVECSRLAWEVRRVSLNVRRGCLAVIILVAQLLACRDGSGQGVARVGWQLRRIGSADLTARMREAVNSPVIAGSGHLDRYLDRLELETATRVRDGEFEHLINYLLQSRRFTTLPPIEPALSAREYVEALAPAERERLLGADSGRVPESDRVPLRVRARIEQFLHRLKSSRLRDGETDPRWRYFTTLIASDKRSPADLLRREYGRTMRFLYRKEFLAREVGKEAQAGYVASLYRTRAHSTDTQLEAGYAVEVALAAIGQAGRERPRMERVLIVGPGHDLAPRTGFLDALPPQSLQPFTLADSLVRHGLADLARLQIHAVDINPRVVEHLERLTAVGAGGVSSLPRLELVSGVAEGNGLSFTADFRDYFRVLGGGIGRVIDERSPSAPQGHLAKRVELDARLGVVLSARRLNIIAERYDPSPRFDLIVVTNVFPYFETRLELPLAVANLAAMLRPGGWLVHNELPIIGESIFPAVGLPVEQVRTLVIASGVGPPLFDGFVIHRKH